MTKIAYLANPYPAISHTFIFREIQSLRKEGLEIATASISRAPDIDKMSTAEQEEAGQTFFLKEVSLLRGALSLFSVIARSPAGFVRMTLKALSFSLVGPTSPLKALGYLAEAVLLVNWLHGNKITHIHEHFANPTALVALLCKAYGGFSYSLSVHGPDIFYKVDSEQLSAKAGSAVFIRCISHYCRSQLMRVLPYRLWRHQHIVRCGVDGAVYRPVRRREAAEPVILCVGRLCPAKGQHVLLESCSELAVKKIPFRLVLVGDGPDGPSLRQLCLQLGLDKQVTFTGVLGQEQVLEQYGRADIFVLPSFAEGVPVVLMEAMAMEIPVVSTRITGIPELIEHGSDGLLATPGRVEELTDHLELLLGNSSMRRRLGKAGRKTVLRRYNLESNNRKLAELLKQYGNSTVRAPGDCYGSQYEGEEAFTSTPSVHK